MNILKAPLLDLRAAFDAVEGAGFFDDSLRRDGQYSVLDCLYWAAKAYREASQDASDDDSGEDWTVRFARALKARDSATIYGAGGWRRYLVRANGEVLFSNHHALPEKIKAAQAAGFQCL